MIDYMEQQAGEIERIQEEIDDCKRRLEDHSNDAKLLKKLYEEGHIDADGNHINKRNEMS